MERKPISFLFFSVFCAMILSVSLFTGCFGDDDKTDTPVVTPTPDTTPPTVVSTVPDVGATTADGNITIQITFSEEINPVTSFTSLNTTDSNCTGAVQVSPGDFVPTSCNPWNGAPTTSDNITFTFTQAAPPLASASGWKIRVTTDVEDIAGNNLTSDWTMANPGFTIP